MSLGKGAIISNYNNQNLNVNSSTEGELVTTHDQCPDILHTLYFIEAQGYTIDKSIIYQDNHSTICLEVNRRISSVKKNKHTSSRFFFITDKIAKREVEVEYFLTEKMWCDIINNTKQGASNIMYCSHLMNVPVDYDGKVERKAILRFCPEIVVYPRPIRVQFVGVCWRVASRIPDGTRHESHDENIFGEQPRKKLVTKDLPSDLLNDKNKKVSDKRSY